MSSRNIKRVTRRIKMDDASSSSSSHGTTYLRSLSPKSQRAAIMTSKRIKQLSKKIKMKYTSNGVAVHTEAPARVPVFQLPRNDLSAIPEEAEIVQGFFVRVSMEPHRTRRYSGLVSLSNFDQRAIERSATKAIEFRSYSCPSFPMVAAQ